MKACSTQETSEANINTFRGKKLTGCQEEFPDLDLSSALNCQKVGYICLAQSTFVVNINKFLGVRKGRVFLSRGILSFLIRLRYIAFNNYVT